MQQSRDNVEAVAADLASARATYARTLRSATAAQAQVRNAVAERQQRQAGVESAQAQVSATAAAVEMARANLVAAQAETERADKDAQRANELYDGGALSAQSRDKSRKDAKSARAQEEAARRAVEQALANRLKAQADTRNAQAQLAGAAAQIAQAQAQFEAARESVNEARAGIDQSRARLKQAQSAVLEERANVDRRVREQLATGNSIRQASATLESNRAALSSTQASLQKLESGSRAEDIAAQRARVVQARSALEVLRRGSRPEEIARLRAAYQSAEELSRKAKLTLREGKVRAPRDGIVDRIFVAPGDLVTTGTALIRISDPNDLWIRVYIPESNLSRVRVGDAAELQINGISEPVAAVVESVATTGEFTPANLQTSEERAKQVFGVRLRLKRVDDRVKPGMFAVTKRIGDWP